MSHRIRTSLLLLVCAPVLGTCNEDERPPISASTLALTAQENTEQALRGVHAAGSFIADSATLAELLSSPTSQDCPPATAVACPSGTLCPPPESPACTDAVTVADLAEGRQSMSEEIDDLVRWLREEIFIAKNLEAEDGTSATYRLSADIFCTSGASTPPASAPGTAPAASTPAQPELDAECVKDSEKMQPRLRLTSPADGAVDVALLLTAAKRNPATLKLAAESVSLVLDLAEIKASLDAAGQSTEDLAALSGKLAFEIKRNAERDYSLSLNLLTSLGLTVVDDLAQQIVFGLAGKTPAIELRLDGAARRLTGTVSLGRFDVRGPLNAFRGFFEEQNDDPTMTAPAPSTVYTGIIELLVGGLDGSVVLDGQQDKIQLKGLGLGEVSSTLRHDGNVLAKLDLNPAAGRHFDLTVERTADDRAKVTVTPTLDVTAMVAFATLQSQIKDLPAYLLGDTMRLWLEGSNPSVSTEPEQVRVLSGSVNLTSTKVPSANLRVEAGACLVESAATSPTHELLGQFAAGICK